MQNFKSLRVFTESHLLTLAIYKASEMFPKQESYGITNQLRRASSSIPANIAEGCGKNSRIDFAKYLNISLGSANETEYFIILAKDLNYLSEELFIKLSEQINNVKKMLIRLIATIRAQRE